MEKYNYTDLLDFCLLVDYPVVSIINNKPNYNLYDALLLIWPPPNSNMASEYLSKFSGNTLVYIGETYEKLTELTCLDSCVDATYEYWKELNLEPPNSQLGEFYVIPDTGDMEFHKKINQEWSLVEKLRIPNFEWYIFLKKHNRRRNYRDFVFIYQRKQ